MNRPHRTLRVLFLATGTLMALLVGCGGAAGTHDDAAGGSASGGSSTGGGSSATGGSGGSAGSGGASGTGGGGVGGSPSTGGTDSGEFDPEDLGTPCEGSTCPTGLTPTNFEVCGIASCDNECQCHVPCEDGVCPEGLSCQTGGFNLPENVCL